MISSIPPPHPHQYHTTHVCQNCYQKSSEQWPSCWGVFIRAPQANSPILSHRRPSLQGPENLTAIFMPRWAFLQRLQGFHHLTLTSCSPPPIPHSILISGPPFMNLNSAGLASSYRTLEVTPQHSLIHGTSQGNRQALSLCPKCPLGPQ